MCGRLEGVPHNKESLCASSNELMHLVSIFLSLSEMMILDFQLTLLMPGHPTMRNVTCSTHGCVTGGATDKMGFSCGNWAVNALQ